MKLLAGVLLYLGCTALVFFSRLLDNDRVDDSPFLGVLIGAGLGLGLILIAVGLFEGDD